MGGSKLGVVPGRNAAVASPQGTSRYRYRSSQVRGQAPTRMVFNCVLAVLKCKPRSACTTGVFMALPRVMTLDSLELYRLRVVRREAGGLAKLAWVVMAEYYGEMTSTKC